MCFLIILAFQFMLTPRGKRVKRRFSQNEESYDINISRTFELLTTSAIWAMVINVDLTCDDRTTRD